MSIFILLLMAFALPALAADEEAIEPVKEGKPVTYSPDTCEFTATFPGEPSIENKCETRSGKKVCYDQVNFTQVFDLDSTVTFRIICNPVDKELRDTYSGEVMKNTLEAMTKKTLVRTFDTSFRENENYKQAGLVGEGTAGKFSTIYIAQLWIGQFSALSVEAEMLGSANDDADTLFSRVLRSVNYVPGKKKPSAEDLKKSEKTADKKADADKAAKIKYKITVDKPND